MSYNAYLIQTRVHIPFMRVLLLLLTLLGVLASGLAQAIEDVRYWSGGPGRNSYDISLLNAALEATRTQYGDFTISVIDKSIGTNRGRRLLAEGKVINIYAAPLRPEHIVQSEHIIPVRFPILKGLLGYRKLIIPKNRQKEFSSIKSVADLAKFRAGQGRGWLDVEILRHNKLPVIDSGIYDQLFDMLRRQRFDYVLLGAHEIDDALKVAKRSHPNLVILPDIVVYYPFPVVFQVSKNTPALAARILTGLKKVQESGEMTTLFSDHFSETLQALRNTRALLEIGNPYVESDSPIIKPILLPFQESPNQSD